METQKKRGGRRKIKIEFIPDKSRRQITFSKRKAGLMKKAYELTTLTGTQALLLVASETGHVYTFATPKLQPFVTLPDGKNLIQSCLNAPEGSGESEHHEMPHDQNGGHLSYESDLAPKQEQQQQQQQQQPFQPNTLYDSQPWNPQKQQNSNPMYEF
mmetsp:Transcript_66141/g.99734  ORF Transcript_66141/g.99734 Transcript_66141/m.99734 type:complete len:157 (+) Transcript_66141:18-488(+)|eukprot:CAMPEP_0117040482 /NCGR_PEP_ID=MMETSP0472-20121206/28327_1 /TAXON_ID=693140 ORGANISM="Tiarina fusus, Strain LIS" /NCGR_SAMPLE_ID=MMETSP0472 /ASSEMBLY_ACC=CAM_ASM_000603 /LENGTH=156 /DNA_ID=CAMNT_0004751225 /DNA_START=13 /DNA_END=483 /DNA_ORIENTATION=+